MNVHNVKIENFQKELDHYSLKQLKHTYDIHRFSCIYYCYSTGCYDGSGHLIVKLFNNKFVYYDICHCSCHGPCDSISYTLQQRTQYDSLDDILLNCSKEAAYYIKPFIEAVKIYDNTTS